MDESHALNAAYRQQIDEIRRAHQKRADLLVLAGYTEQREKMAARKASALAGEFDHTFTFMQRAHYMQTGECVALLP